jgi:hypothetical protein
MGNSSLIRVVRWLSPQGQVGVGDHDAIVAARAHSITVPNRRFGAAGKRHGPRVRTRILL